MNTRARSETKIVSHRVWRKISKRTTALFLITLLGSLLAFSKTRIGITEPLFLHSSAMEYRQLPTVANAALTPSQENTGTRAHEEAETVVNRSSQLWKSEATLPVNSQHLQVHMGQALLSQLPPVAKEKIAPRPTPVLAQVSPRFLLQGTQLSLNGRTYRVAWRQWQIGTSVRTAISDVGLMQSTGLELLSTRDWTRQPIQWFTDPQSTPLVLASQLDSAYRYLDVSDFAKIAGWQLQAVGDTLQITSVPARLENIQTGTQAWGSRIVLNLDRPIPWQVSDRRTEGLITLDALADPSLVERFNAPPPQQTQDAEDAAPVAVETQSDKPIVRVENSQNQTTIRVQIPEGKRLQVFTVPNPYRLVIDLRPDALLEKEILWAPGIRWRQQYVNLGESRFPVVWLEVDPRANRMSLKPIWSNPATQVGTAPLIKTAQLWQATAAINAGFFNRNNQLPLGAIRRDGRWFSGQVLNRGAIAWNDQGQIKIGRLTLQETLTTSTGVSLPVLMLNTGYVQSGIARYTPEWGQSYTPLINNEVLVYVQNNRVMTQVPGGIAGQTSFPIPTDGYILTLRADATSASGSLAPGTQVGIEQSTAPADFASYPQILGAGPLLLQNRQIALEASVEQFGGAFHRQAAVRSVVGTTSTGTLILAAIHPQAGGRGPTLAETAQLMQQMGAIDALNFDGGSSTGLYLGGQLLDRSPYTAARVHNALGLFLTPRP